MPGQYLSNREPTHLLCGFQAERAGTASKYGAIEMAVPATKRIEIVDVRLFGVSLTAADAYLSIRAATGLDATPTTIDFSGSVFGRTATGASGVVVKHGIHTANLAGAGAFQIDANQGARATFDGMIIPVAPGAIFAIQTVAQAAVVGAAVLFFEYSV